MVALLDSAETVWFKVFMTLTWIFPLFVYFVFDFVFLGFYWFLIGVILPVLVYGIYLRNISYFDSWFDRYVLIYGVLNFLYVFVLALVAFILMVGTLVSYSAFMLSDYVSMALALLTTVFMSFIFLNLTYGIKYFLMYYVYYEKEYIRTDGLFRNKMFKSFVKNAKMTIKTVLVSIALFSVISYYVFYDFLEVISEPRFLIFGLSFLTMLLLAVELSILPKRFALNVRGKF